MTFGEYVSSLERVGRLEIETAFYMVPPDKRLECLEALAARTRELGGDVEETERLFAEIGVKDEKRGEKGNSEDFENSAPTLKIPFEPFEKDDDDEKMPFPVQCLPEVIQGIVRDTAESLQVPPDFAAMAVLGIISTCIQGKYQIELKPGWIEQVNLYLITAARPSERKSPTLQVFTPALDRYVEEENKLRDSAVQEYRTKKAILEGAIESAKKKLSNAIAKGEPVDYTEIDQAQRDLANLKEVSPIRLVADNVTPEKLVSLMVENDGKMSIISAEGGIFDILAGQYSEKANIDLVLKAYTGESFFSDRVGRKSEYIKSPHLTMLLMVQPSVAEKMIGNPDFTGRGFTSRFLYSYPESAIGKGRKFETSPISQDSKDIFESLTYTLLKIPQKNPPELLTLSKEALLIFKDFFYDIEGRLNKDLFPIEGWAGKIVGNAGRIAANLHCCIHQEESAKIPVSGKTMMGAVEIAKYFISHAKLIFGLAGAMDTPQEKDAKYILKRLDAYGEHQISKRDLYRLCRGKFNSVDEMIEGLTLLELHGYLYTQRDNREGAGRKSEKIILSPDYIAQFTQKGSYH